MQLRIVFRWSDPDQDPFFLNSRIQIGYFLNGRIQIGFFSQGSVPVIL